MNATQKAKYEEVTRGGSCCPAATPAAFMSRDTPAAFMNLARAYPHPRLRAAERGIRVYEPEMARPRL